MARKLLIALACAAGTGIPAGVQRFEVQPFAGYTVAGELPLDRHNPGAAFIRFKNSASATAGQVDSYVLILDSERALV